MKKGIFFLAICAGVAVAETVTNNLDVQGGFIYNHGIVNPGDLGLTFTNAGVRDITVSAGQLSGVNPETGEVITNSANLLPLKAQSVTAGSFAGNAGGLTNLNAGAISSGSIDAARLPISGIWNAAGVTVSNLTVSGASISGNVAAMTNLTLGGAPLAQAISNLQQQVSAVYTSRFSVTVRVTDNETTNGANLIAAYTKAKTFNPSSSNRVAVIVPPGRYNLGTSGLVMDTPYIDLIGQTTDRAAQYLYGAPNQDNGVIKQTADYVRIENLTLYNQSSLINLNSSDPAAYFPIVSGSNTVVRNCEFTGGGSMRISVEYAGHYEHCTAGNYSFGGGDGGDASGTASGTFINCTAGAWSFGGYGTASGTFMDCTGGDQSFGGNGLEASGAFINCTAGAWSFGGGTQIFSRATSYAKNPVSLDVNGGTLIWDVWGSTGMVTTVGTGGTLGGTGVLDAAVTVAGNLKPGNTGSPGGTMTCNGALTLEPTATLTLEIVSASVCDVLKNDGNDTITFNTGANIIFDFTGNTTVSNGSTYAVLQTWSSIVTNGATFTAVGLAAGQSLDVSALDSSGILAVVSDALPSYTLTVNNGTGSGSYTNGHVQAIVATAPGSGFAFDKWTGDTQYVASVSSASTTVTMPAQAVAVTATYVATEQYTTNGTPYSWLTSYGLTNYETDAVLDQDNDGLKAWQEYIAGTVPTNAASVLKAAQAVRNVVTWSAVSGRVYSVYWSTNLVKGFTNLADNIVYPQGSYTNTIPDARVNHYQVKARLP